MKSDVVRPTKKERLRVVFIDLGIGTSVVTFIRLSAVRPYIDVNLNLN